VGLNCDKTRQAAPSYVLTFSGVNIVQYGVFSLLTVLHIRALQRAVQRRNIQTEVAVRLDL
jgi:hypothetical protein